MDAYLWWSGVVANAVIIIAATMVVFAWFIHPAFEAASMVRYYKTMQKVHGIKMHNVFRLFINSYEPFGRRFTATRCQYGYWEGIGKWRVYDCDNE